ncbi:AraC family transcriptional regulator [Vibrio parahaemolyticus]|nr:AraC family transcriptional regulator [Vibrio parahaemolyticus]
MSHEVGYEDVRYFRELFKKSNDMTPLEYRKRYQR